jgi:hypothetical protein
MKKVLFAIAILFSVNCKAQDTTYYLKQQKLYMSIRSEVTNPNECEKAFKLQQQKRKRKDRIYTIVAGTIFASISVWFWNGYHQ